MGQDSAGFGGDPQRGPVSPAGRAVGEMVSGAKERGYPLLRVLNLTSSLSASRPPPRLPGHTALGGGN